MITTRNHNKGPHSLFVADHVMVCTKQAVLSLFFRKSFNNKNNQTDMKKKTNTAIKQENKNEPLPCTSACVHIRRRPMSASAADRKGKSTAIAHPLSSCRERTALTLLQHKS
jgi:hypothetical protein